MKEVKHIHAWVMGDGPWICADCGKENWSTAYPPGNKEDLITLYSVTKTGREWIAKGAI